MPVPALRDRAVRKSLERLCGGGEINYVIAAVSRELSGKQPAADARPGIRTRSAFYRYFPVLATGSM
ncbi:hypothetical protein ACFCYL_42545, partial [Streptomyces sp. NPDC056305]|uniref:hypothetical protein n=1 Tax=Streptomyces sp. NPDC056305 TaxID=3345779 RepID=UPI0035DB8565